MCATCTLLRRTHDSVTATGNHHEIVPDHFPREIFRQFVIGRIGRSACRPKNDHFSKMPKWRKNLRRVTHFFYGAIDQLEVRYAHFIARYLQRGNDHFLDQFWRLSCAPIANQLAHSRIKWRIDGPMR